MKQPGDSSHKHMGVGLASTLAKGSTLGLHDANGVQRNCVCELTLARAGVFSVFPSILL